MLRKLRVGFFILLCVRQGELLAGNDVFLGEDRQERLLEVAVVGIAGVEVAVWVAGVVLRRECPM